MVRSGEGRRRREDQPSQSAGHDQKDDDQVSALPSVCRGLSREHRDRYKFTRGCVNQVEGMAKPSEMNDEEQRRWTVAGERCKVAPPNLPHEQMIRMPPSVAQQLRIVLFAQPDERHRRTNEWR